VALGMMDVVSLSAATVLLLIATLGEEIGWHGVALPGLQQRHGVLWSSAVLGLLWATWHLPFWALLDPVDEFGFGYIVLNYLFIIPLAFYTTWFFNGAKWSLLLPVAFHVTFNVVNTALLPVTLDPSAFGALIVLEWLLAIGVIPALATTRWPASAALSGRSTPV
jgi:membrane protease YdiL (CAAX protease family)